MDELSTFPGLVIPYELHEKTQQIDYDRLRETAKRERPKLIWVGGTAYPRVFDYAAMAEIAQEANSYLVADIAHVSGLIVAGAHPKPVRHATSSAARLTSQSAVPAAASFCRGMKTAIKRTIIRRANTISPGGLIGRSSATSRRPHMNIIAALAVAVHEAESASFRTHGQQVVKNAKALAEALLERGCDLVTGGTDNQMLILDLRDRPLSGRAYAERLAKAGIIANFNMVPGDPRDPAVTAASAWGRQQ